MRVAVDPNRTGRNLYEFTVAFDGYFSICERNADIWSLVADWTYTSAMIQGENSWNNLRVDTDGTTIRFYVNDVLVHTIAGSSYSSGCVGLVAYEGDDSSEPVHILYDNFYVESYDSDSTTFQYYLPYFLSDATNCTSVALKNLSSTQMANATSIMYDDAGNMISATDKNLEPKGQDAFLVAQGSSQEGWILVNSSQKLAGLCFISTVANPDYMMGIRLISELSTCLHVPHVAQNSRWDTTAFVCNPNDYQITVTFAYVDQNGDAKQTRMVWLPSTGFIRSLSATNDYAYP